MMSKTPDFLHTNKKKQKTKVDTQLSMWVGRMQLCGGKKTLDSVLRLTSGGVDDDVDDSLSNISSNTPHPAILALPHTAKTRNYICCKCITNRHRILI